MAQSPKSMKHKMRNSALTEHFYLKSASNSFLGAHDHAVYFLLFFFFFFD